MEKCNAKRYTYFKGKSSKKIFGSLKGAEFVLDKLTEAVESDPKGCGGVALDKNNTISILHYQSRYGKKV